MAKVYKSRFKDSWLEDDVFKDWVERNPDDCYKYYCKWCNVSGKLSDTGKKALVRHMRSKKHQKADPQYEGGELIIQSCLPKNNQIMSPSPCSSPPASTYSNIETLKNIVVDSNKKKTATSIKSKFFFLISIICISC